MYSWKMAVYSYNPPDESLKIEIKGKNWRCWFWWILCMACSSNRRERFKIQGPIIFKMENILMTQDKYGDDIFLDYITSFIERIKMILSSYIPNVTTQAQKNLLQIAKNINFLNRHLTRQQRQNFWWIRKLGWRSKIL